MHPGLISYEVSGQAPVPDRLLGGYDSKREVEVDHISVRETLQY